MGQFGHCVCRCLNALTGQLSPYGNVIGWGSLCPLKRLIFSSAVSNGLSQQHTPLDSLLLHAIELIDLLTSYSIHRPSTCKPHSMRIDSTLKAPQSQLCHLFWNWLSQTVPVPKKKSTCVCCTWVPCFQKILNEYHQAQNDKTNLIWNLSDLVSNHLDFWEIVLIEFGKLFSRLVYTRGASKSVVCFFVVLVRLWPSISIVRQHCDKSNRRKCDSK